MYQNPKSATTAGLLGIFLGAVGAHNWYLGEKGKGIAHVCMMSGGFLLEIIVGAVLPNVLSYSMLYNVAWLLAILAPIALAAMSASGIWGLIEGIIILSQGDAGLARKGYLVADPITTQNYGHPMNGYGSMNMNGMNSNMNGMNMNGMGMNMGMNGGANGDYGPMGPNANNMNNSFGPNMNNMGMGNISPNNMNGANNMPNGMNSMSNSVNDQNSNLNGNQSNNMGAQSTGQNQNNVQSQNNNLDGNVNGKL